MLSDVTEEMAACMYSLSHYVFFFIPVCVLACWATWRHILGSTSVLPTNPIQSKYYQMPLV